jgi:hypothetical protein
LKAVAEIHSKNKTLRSEQSIAHALKKRPEYAAMSERTLRRRVKSVLDWEMGLLKKLPTDLWKELLGISPSQGAVLSGCGGQGIAGSPVDARNRAISRHRLAKA